MATFGKTTAGVAAVTLSANMQRGRLCVLPEAGTIESISYYVDGNGGGSGTQYTKGVLYANGSTYPTTRHNFGHLVTITAGQSAGWVTSTFTTPIYLPAGSYWLNIISGTTDSVGRYWRDASGGTLVSGIADTFLTGPSTPCPSGGTISSIDMSIFATYTAGASSVSKTLWPEFRVEGAIPASPLDTLRIFKGAGATYVDMTSGTDHGYSEITMTKVINGPGSLEFNLAAATPDQLLTWIDENTCIEYWHAGVRRGCYYVDDFTPNWAGCTAQVTCIGAMALANRCLVTHDSPVTIDVLMVAAVANEIISKGLGHNWRWDDDTVDIGSQDFDLEAANKAADEWLYDAAGLIGAEFWVDDDWYFHGALLPDPETSEAVDHTYEMGETCFNFETTYSARDIVNSLIVECANAPSPSEVVVEDAASQALYGVRQRAVTFDEATTLAAATAYGTAQLATLAWPQLSITLTVPHDFDTRPGEVALVTGVGVDSIYPADGSESLGELEWRWLTWYAINSRRYRGIIQQVTWNLGDDTDEVIIGARPVSIAAAISTIAGKTKPTR